MDKKTLLTGAEWVQNQGRTINQSKQQCNNAEMQQCNSAAMQQCSNGTMQQCNNATMQQDKPYAISVFRRHLKSWIKVNIPIKPP